MKKITLVCVFFITLMINGCGGSSNKSTSSQNNKDNNNNNNPTVTSYKAVAPLRYLAENYTQLSDEKIAKYLDALSDKDKDNLGRYYSSFAQYLQHQACNFDPSIKVKQTPTMMTIDPIELTCQENDAYIQQFIDLEVSLGYYVAGAEFKNAHSKASDLLTVIKCDSGEIDAGSCSLYNSILSQFQSNTDDFYKQMLESNAEFTRQLAEQCSYDGQILSNGAMCVI